MADRTRRPPVGPRAHPVSTRRRFVWHEGKLIPREEWDVLTGKAPITFPTFDLAAISFLHEQMNEMWQRYHRSG